jgi:hypothetical protein
MNQLGIVDRRGESNSIRLVLTDWGFKLTLYGNIVLDASNVNQDGLIEITKSRVKTVDENEYIQVLKVNLY